ncbi:MAG: Hsp20/alpha crystallin family protein [Calditrichales bacterium]|nr:MAG: Hsp20/alpha crystallin family protein [Calditrichales bacterium]
MTLVKWNPARSLFNLGEDFFTDVMNSNNLASNFREGCYPAVDILEDDSKYHVQMELPGLEKEDVKISFKDDVLIISGEKKAEKDESNKNYHHFERRYGKFERAFRVNSEIITDKIDATFKNGVLIIDLPKAEIAKPKEIEVKVK